MSSVVNEAPQTPLAASEVLSSPSHVPGLAIRLLHQRPLHESTGSPVLFIHGSSFPSALSFAFEMDGKSWMDVMASNGYDSYALDFLGYGKSDRYPEMWSGGSRPVGRAREARDDIDRAVDLVRERAGGRKVTLIAHSWGGLVAAMYAQAHSEKIAALVLFAAIPPSVPVQTSRPEEVTRVANDMLPEERIRRMDRLRPADQPSVLAKEVFTEWGPRWLASDPQSSARKLATVRFPAGPDQDLADLGQGAAFYDPAAITVPTLLIRGGWDTFPSDAHFKALFGQLTQAPYKKYVVVPDGTHVMHLERSRHRLYDEVLRFLSGDGQ